MRFVFIFFISFFLLSSCTLPGTQTETADNTVLYDSSAFSVSLPKTWTVATGSTLPSPKK